jgi:hypothetical protein
MNGAQLLQIEFQNAVMTRRLQGPGGRRQGGASGTAFISPRLRGEVGARLRAG